MQIASITTNGQGEYEYATEEDYLEQTLDFVIQKEGFETKNISYEIDKAEIKSDILLNELEKGTKEKTKIFGTIRNSKNRDPVKDASIKLSIEGKQIASISSNEQGEYEYTTEEDYTGQTLDYVIQKEGYIKKNISYEIDSPEIKSDILIDEFEIEIKGKICDKADRPLADASISFRIGGKTIKLTSDKDGSYSFTAGQQFLNQTIGYEVSKEGFKVKSGKLKLIEYLKCINLDPTIPIPPIKVAAVLIALSVLAIFIIAIPGGPSKLAIDPDPLNFDFKPDTEPQTFSIWNENNKFYLIFNKKLEWNVSTNADWITVNPTIGTEAHTVTVSINSNGLQPGSYTDSITVTSNGGNKTGNISLYIEKELIINSFTADPETISAGEGSTLHWDVSGATNVTIDGIGNVDPIGEIDVYPYETNIYILRATNELGKNVKTVILNVGDEPIELPIIHSFIADPNNISVGEGSTLRWNVSGATSVTIDGIGRVNSADERNVDPDINTNYILEATNEAGLSNFKTVTVNVEYLQPKLSVDPDILNFGTISVGDKKSLTFKISNDGGGTLNWNVGNKPNWITIRPTSGSSGTVSVTANTANLNDGIHRGNIVIGSNGGQVSIPVTVNVEDLKPKLSVEPDILNFGTISVGDKKSLTFKISNDGGGTLNWNVGNKPNWITIRPTSGSSGTVTVTASTANLNDGIHRGNIVIDSNGGTKTINVYLTVNDIKYVKYLVSLEEDLIVPNGLCEDGTKKCELFDTYHGGYYYAMVGNYVALNGNPEKLKTITIDDKIVLHVGQQYKISDGIELTAVEIDVEGGEVWLALIQDGKELTSSVVYKGEIFTYTEEQIEGESDVPMFVAYVETMFAGMNTNMVKVRYVWSIV